MSATASEDWGGPETVPFFRAEMLGVLGSNLPLIESAFLMEFHPSRALQPPYGCKKKNRRPFLDAGFLKISTSLRCVMEYAASACSQIDAVLILPVSCEHRRFIDGRIRQLGPGGAVIVGAVNAQHIATARAAINV